MTAAVPEHGQDLLVLADRIHTCASPRPVSALLVRGGRIVAAGGESDLRALTRSPRRLDLRGTVVTPGLHDAHAHLTEYAFSRRQVDLSGARTPAEAADMAIAARPDATGWIRGRGWNPHAWQGTHPTRALLDGRTDHPVALQSHDMHSLWVNSAALAAAGIDPSTPDPEGGTIVRDEDGAPTGLLLEWAGQLVTDRIPRPSLEAAADAVLDAQAELHSLGVTGMHSFPGIHLLDPDPRAVIGRLRERGELRLRILQHVALDRFEDAAADGFRSGAGDDWVRCGGVKMFLDGALGSRTAWMREPYEDGSGTGMRTMEPDVFRDVVRRAASLGISTVVHAIGDAAVSLALDVLSDPAVRVTGMPHRIEHIQCCPPERLSDAARAGIVCSVQPSHLITDWSIADREWGARARYTYAFGSLQRAGTILAFGSDAPVEPIDPRRGLYAAVTRRDLSGCPPAGWFPEQCISGGDALLGYTVGAARAAGLAPPAGTLAPGALADFVAWDSDPCEHTESIMQTRCVVAVVDGEIVHAS